MKNISPIFLFHCPPALLFAHFYRTLLLLVTLLPSYYRGKVLEPFKDLAAIIDLQEIGYLPCDVNPL